MKFLFHFYDLDTRAGIQRAICELANALVEQGEQVVIANASSRAECVFFLDDRVVVERTPYPEHKRSGPAAWLSKVLWAARELRALRTIVRRHRPSMIVDHGTAIGLVYPFASLCGAPLVLQRHFPVANFPRGKILYRLLKPLSGRRVVVALTEGIAADFRRLGYKRVVAIPNMIPATACAASYSDAVPRTGLLIGRAVNVQKGFDLFLRALAVTGMQGWRFTIVGPKIESDRLLIGLIREFGLTEQVVLLPATDNPYGLIRKTSLVIVPSRYEGFPLVALESLSIGRPVLCSDADGLREAVTHDVNGLVFPCGDAGKLSECLRRVRDEPELLPVLAGNTSVGLEQYRRESVLRKWRSLAASMASDDCADTSSSRRRFRLGALRKPMRYASRASLLHRAARELLWNSDRK
jgi:glycosyltransferase involved in cell wall biosynthesis